jgi:hypothetical protein
VFDEKPGLGAGELPSRSSLSSCQVIKDL